MTISESAKLSPRRQSLLPRPRTRPAPPARRRRFPSPRSPRSRAPAASRWRRRPCGGPRARRCGSRWTEICRARTRIASSLWRQLYKNRSSRKIDSRRLFSREYDFPKTFSLSKNPFSGKTYIYTIHPRRGGGGGAADGGHDELGRLPRGRVVVAVAAAVISIAALTQEPCVKLSMKSGSCP